MKDVIDLHTHTIASGHAYSTMNEMIHAAVDKGLEILGITEHAPALEESCRENYFVNLKILPRQRNGITVLYGAELNILDRDGHIDLPDTLLEKMDIVIASIHGFCYPHNTDIVYNTDAYLNVMQKHRINLIGHPDDYPVDYKAIVECAKACGTLLELNCTSLNPVHYRFQNAEKNNRIMLEYCSEMEVPIVISSDAHVDLAVADHGKGIALLEEIGFPEHLIANANPEILKNYLNYYKN